MVDPLAPSSPAIIGLLEDAFIQKHLNIPVTVFLTNGVKLDGAITTNSPTCIFLARDGVVQLVMKHAVATIMPSKAA